MTDREISIIIKSDAQKAQAGIKNFGMSLTDLKSGIDLAMGAARTFAQVARQAFDFTKAGAAVIQTTASFKGMGLSLEALRQAAGGTIDDMSLMSSAMALLAGASDTLSPALEGSLGGLMEIARAAAKLNPTLGTAQQQFENLALGIKRGSPMILDNLGLTINLGEANADYAASIGKTVEQLTEEERKIALLHATLRAGDALIEQAGGTVESYGDAWARAEASLKNLSDTMKAMAAEDAAPTLNFLSDTTDTFSKLVQIIHYAREEYGFLGGSWQAFWSVVGADTDMMKEAALRQRALAEGAQAAAQGFSDVGASAPAATQGIEDAGEAAANASIAYLNAAAGLGEMATAAFVNAQLEALRVALEGTEDGAQQLALATEALLVKFGLLTPAEQSASSTLDTLRQMALDGTLTWDAYAAAVAGVKGSLDTLESKEITIGVKFDVQDLVIPGGGGGQPWTPVATPMAGGGDFLATTPTHLLVGEAGAEHVTVTPVSQTNNDINVNFYNTPDPTQNVAALRALWGG